MSNDEAKTASEKVSVQVSTPWTDATVDDVHACNIDAHIPTGTAADWHSLHNIFHSAANRDDINPATKRVFRMLGGLLSMMLDAKSSAEPFRPMMVWADGSRSAILEDFKPCVDALVAIATQSHHPAIVSRAADVAWTLERRRHEMGLAALDAYCLLLDEVAAGYHLFKHEVEQEGGRLGIGVLRRCIVIARSRSFGTKAPDLAPLAMRLETARQHALHAGEVSRHRELAELSLDYGLQKTEILAADIEASIAELEIGTHGHLIADTLKIAAGTYYRANKASLAHAVQKRISDVYFIMSDQVTHSAIMASSLVAKAISALAGVRDAKDRRRELRHRLIDVQAGIGDEMGTISQPLDIESARTEVAKQVDNLGFYDALFFFAVMQQSPDPNQARDDAVKAMKAHPLSGLFAASFHDREGKVRHASTGGRGFGTVNASDLDAQIARRQSIGRVVKVGLLEVARNYIARSFYISPDILLPVLSPSPFVPEGKESTFAQGLRDFLCGDMTRALYTLTPLVEAGMRSCLKLSGYEVTTFDDASQTQEDKSISALYGDQRADIEAVFGSALTFNIEQVFLHPAGPSLRHGVAHGLLNDGDPFSHDGFYACWLVLHLCLLPLYGKRRELGLIGMEPLPAKP